jgi:hypothetical protein
MWYPALANGRPHAVAPTHTPVLIVKRHDWSVSQLERILFAGQRTARMPSLPFLIYYETSQLLRP